MHLRDINIKIIHYLIKEAICDFKGTYNLGCLFQNDVREINTEFNGIIIVEIHKHKKTKLYVYLSFCYIIYIFVGLPPALFVWEEPYTLFRLNERRFFAAMYN